MVFVRRAVALSVLFLSGACFLTTQSLLAASGSPSATPTIKQSSSVSNTAKVGATESNPSKPATEVKLEATPSPVESNPKKVGSQINGEKSGVLATVLAVVPGVLVHGSGHLYAGSYGKGLGLLGIEVASVAVITINALQGWNDIQSFINSKNNNGGNSGGSSIPQSINSPLGRVGIMSVATFAFLFSWFDDISGAAIATGKYNDRLSLQNQTSLLVLPSKDGQGALLSFNQKF